MKIKLLLLFLVVALIILFIANEIVYGMAKSMCEESAVRPIRYESQGLFGVLTPIETTPEKADGYGRVCTKTNEPNYWSISENIKYLVDKSGGR